MGKFRHLRTQGLIKIDLTRGVIDMVSTANNVAHLHVDIVNHNSEVIGRNTVTAHNHQIVQFGIFKRNRAIDHVIPGNRAGIGIAETDYRRDAFRNRTTDTIFRTPATVVTRLNLLGHLFFAQGFQLFLGGVALISQALFEHHIDHFFIAVQTIHLVDRTFVVIEFQPLHAIDDHVNGFLRGALLVRIFDTKEELAAYKVACIGPAVNSRAGGAQVHHSGRRRCDTRANFFHFVLLETIKRIC